MRLKSNARRDERIPTLSAKEAIILEMLVGSSGSQMYGLELVRKSAGRLKRGTVYVTLNRMEDKSYVESQQDKAEADSGTLPRRLYRATGYGQRVYEAWQLAKDARRWCVQRAVLG